LVYKNTFYYNDFYFFFAFLANSSSISLYNAIKCKTSLSAQIFSTFSPSSSSSFIVTIVAFFFVAFFLGRGASLGIYCKSKSLSTCENDCFNLPWPKLSILTSQTPSFWTFPRIGNAFLRTTTLCGFTKPTLPTLYVFENGMVGVHSTMSSSSHEMSYNFNLKNRWKKNLEINYESWMNFICHVKLVFIITTYLFTSYDLLTSLPTHLFFMTYLPTYQFTYLLNYLHFFSQIPSYLLNYLPFTSHLPSYKLVPTSYNLFT